MFERDRERQRGQSIILVAVALFVVLAFVAIAVDLTSAYVLRRRLQNAADGAALASIRRMAYQIRYTGLNDGEILLELNEFANRNVFSDTRTLADIEGRVEGLYLGPGPSYAPIQGGVVGDGDVPSNAMGVEATVYGIAPSFFGPILGFDGYPVQAKAAAALQRACRAGCLLPIAFEALPFCDPEISPGCGDAFENTLEEGECYNIWVGGGPGNFGWLNWSAQHVEYGAAPCSVPSLRTDLNPAFCRSTVIEVGDWVGGSTGTENDKLALSYLEYYIDGTEDFPGPIPVTILVWDVTNGLTGCDPNVTWDGNGDPLFSGLAYRAKGFARMEILGYQLSQGVGNEVWYPEGFSFDECETTGEDPNSGVRITARFLKWADGTTGDCEAGGNVWSPRLIY